MLKLLTTILLLTTAFTCNKNEEPKYKDGADGLVTYAYAQTQCADPWSTSPDDRVTEQNVARYLDSAGVEVASVVIEKESDAANCLACTCPSGKTIYVKTKPDQQIKAKIKELRFN